VSRITRRQHVQRSDGVNFPRRCASGLGTSVGSVCRFASMFGIEQQPTRDSYAAPELLVPQRIGLPVDAFGCHRGTPAWRHLATGLYSLRSPNPLSRFRPFGNDPIAQVLRPSRQRAMTSSDGLSRWRRVPPAVQQKTGMILLFLNRSPAQ
jgi:hypothetical protein